MEGEAVGWYTDQAFVSTPQTKYPLSPAIVESVRDGTTLRVRLFMPDGEHQFVNITLAGARSPRAASRQGETSEPLGDEVSCVNAQRVLLGCANSLTPNGVGKIFHRIASSSTGSQSATSFRAHRDRDTVPNKR
jgi:hypothetical protein